MRTSASFPSASAWSTSLSSCSSSAGQTTSAAQWCARRAILTKSGPRQTTNDRLSGDVPISINKILRAEA
eukprot:2883395-Pleurochrysis_carterae.AAC.1